MNNLSSFIKKLEKPLLVILGSTAVGKSKLAIELAEKLNGEIISADSMQVYQGLDIITNKVTEEEQRKVKHHLINIIKPPAEFTVTDFQKQSLDIIEKLHEKDILPVIIGGTNYYIESILWNFLIEEKKCHTDSHLKRKLIPDEDSKLDEGEKKYLYDELLSVDPERANQLHPNNTRKIARSLQIFRESGMKHSDIIKNQQENEGSSHLGGPSRFDNVLIFWLTSDQTILEERICSRVDQMIANGLLKEVEDFYEEYKMEKYAKEDIIAKPSSKSERKLYTEGIFQAIGFKEFHPYFTLDVSSNKTDKLLKECIENFKKVTIKYSKKQKKWVTHRMVNRDNSFNIYELDASDINSWNNNVFEKAFEVSKQFLNGDIVSAEPIPKTISSTVDKHKRFTCEICDNRIIIGENTWDVHVNSKSHKYRLRKRKKES